MMPLSRDNEMTFGLRVKLPPVHHTLWRAQHFFLALNAQQESVNFNFHNHCLTDLESNPSLL